MCMCLCDVFLIATQQQLKDNDLNLFALAREREMHEISHTHLIHIVTVVVDRNEMQLKSLFLRELWR